MQIAKQGVNSKQQGKTLHNGKFKQLISLNSNITISTQVLQYITLTFPRCYIYSFSLSLSLSLIFLLYFPFSFSFFNPPPPFASPLPFIASILALIIIAVMLLAKVSGIFSLTLLNSSSPLSQNSNFWRLFVLFRLSQLYLMWQRLGKNPIINQEAKIFNLLACSGSFPWFQESP